MALSDYTSYSDVRAALGVGTKEITDDTLALSLYEDSLMVILEDIGDSFLDDLQTLKSEDEGTLTKTQRNLLRLSRLFATYAVAQHLTSTLPLFSPQQITDGKAAFSRFSDDPYTKTVEKVVGLFQQYQTKLDEAYSAYKSTSSRTNVTPVLLAISSPSTDPVTGS